MICPACRHDNPERAKFCLECGHRIAQGETGVPPVTPDRPAMAPAAPARSPDYETRLAAYMPRHLAEKILKSPAATIQSVADEIPEPALTVSLLSWDRVRAVHDDLERLRRGSAPPARDELPPLPPTSA